MRYDHSPLLLNGPYTAMEPWACEAGCGHFCDILSVEASSRFLKVKSRCPTCGKEATTHWDLAKHDWAEIMDLMGEKSDGIEKSGGSFNYETGPFDVKRSELRIGLDDIEEIIATASNHPDVTKPQLDTSLEKRFERTCHITLLRQF